ncbi:MAG: hypothetical protein HY664_01485 [Chloroflexi bacterium]|nr:hypothetical protein [Chloroflexota bacterium]
MPVASALLGDRVAVRAIRIDNRKITVAMRVRGPRDPFVVLTREVTRTYALQDGQLILESEEAADVPSTPPGQFSYEARRLAVEVGKTAVQRGTLKPGELATYLLRGEAGQEMSVSVRSQFSNAILSIQGLEDSTQLVSRSSYATAWSAVLATTQDYMITVITLAGNDLNYELAVGLGRVPTPVPTATATPAPTAMIVTGDTGSAATISAPLSGYFRPEQRPLASLSSEAAQFIDSRLQPWSAAVVLPSDAAIYSQNGDAQLELASVVKVLVMLAILDAAQRENRYVDRFELSLLWPMITLSDNDSATKLWDQLRGGRGLAQYLASIGATGFSPYEGPFWGTSRASANSLAILLARAAFGDLLNNEHRALFLTLLQRVTPSQRWGVSAGAQEEGSAGELVGLKNGWYPAETGWRVNSVGFVVSPDDRHYFTIAVLSNAQPSQDYGIATIEGVAERVHSALLSQSRTPP